eukprot:6174793-Pleurochrysis_carterae.AAC.1
MLMLMLMLMLTLMLMLMLMLMLTLMLMLILRVSRLLRFSAERRLQRLAEQSPALSLRRSQAHTLS